MNQDEKNRAFFQATFEEVHASEGLCRKVKNMTKTEGKKIGMSVAKKLAVAAAVAAVLFAGSNVAAYATTGSTWLETVVVRFNVNGVTYDTEFHGEQNEDGTVTYSGVVETLEGDVVTNILTDAEGTEQEYLVVMDYTAVTEGATVIEEAGKTYFTDGDVKIDITEDLTDGNASVSYEKNGIAYQYEIKEEPELPGCYELHLINEEE